MKEKSYIFACVTEWPPRNEDESKWMVKCISRRENGLLAGVVDIPDIFTFKEKNWLEWLVRDRNSRPYL